MKRLFSGAGAATLLAAAAMTLGVTAAAQAAPAPKATKFYTSPDFHCLTASACVFQGRNWTGFAEGFPTASDSEQWIDLTNPFGGGPSGLKLPWGSFNDNSGSSVAFGDDQTNHTKCYPPHSRISEPSVTHYRYLWIEFGNTNCTGHLGPLPGHSIRPTVAANVHPDGAYTNCTPGDWCLFTGQNGGGQSLQTPDSRGVLGSTFDKADLSFANRTNGLVRMYFEPNGGGAWACVDATKYRDVFQSLPDRFNNGSTADAGYMDDIQVNIQSVNVASGTCDHALPWG
jgi:hypothetical protein